MRGRRVPLWSLFGVVLVVALLIGGGAFSSSPPTAAQRAYAIESVIRCPSCEDLSVATSSAPTAATVRTEVRSLIGEGRSDQQIKDYLVARYGAAIVLDPPTTGWSALVWVLPIGVGLVAVAAVSAVLVRRRRGGGGDDERVDPVTAPHLVEERRRFLTRSLADADAEYLAGDMSDADYLTLRRRDLDRLTRLGPATGSTLTAPVGSATATVVAEPGHRAGATAESADTGVGRRRNKWFLVTAVACFVGALIVAVPAFSSDRLPGQTATGGVSLSPSEQVARQLDQAAATENQGQLGPAAQLYQSVLDAHPANEVALAQLGWLEYRIGQQGGSTTLLADARAKLSRAATLDPGDYAVHLYLGTVVLQLDGNAAGAVDQFAQFLADKPPAAVLTQAAPVLRQAYTAAGRPIPSAIPTV